MPTITLRFYEELNDFVEPSRKKVPFEITVAPHRTIKDIIESIGVPHTEVDLILANGVSVGFAYRPTNSDKISVYPVFESFDISPVVRLRPSPLRDLRFVADVHLGKLTRYLRLLGFDVLYDNSLDDDEIVDIAKSEGRIVLTSDRGLLKRGDVTHGYCVRSDDADQQLIEVLRRFDCASRTAPFSRCMKCNKSLEEVAKEEVVEQLEPKTRKYYEEFRRCTGCGKIYWKGTHFERLQSLISATVDE
jgi:uncharacterized protein with PIN domain